jgi:5-methylcytosine-specific restriction endonuclease McrA
MEAIIKQCSSCLRELNVSEFSPKKNYKYGVDSRCKECVASYLAEYGKKNRAKLSVNQRQYRIQKADQFKEYYNKPEVKARLKEWEKNNPHHKLCREIRARTRLILKRALSSNKIGPISNLIGCSGHELVRYIESQWLPGMSWGNRSEWHIDHIIPISSFNLLDPEQRAKASHYSNLRPLWAKDNKAKSDLLPDGSRGRYLR